MTFIRRQIRQIRSGGMTVLRGKVRDFPGWLLRWLVTSKYISNVAYYGFRVAVSLRPDWATGRILLAETLISSGRFDEAMVDWKQALLLKPDWMDTRNIHWAFFVHGQTDKARDVMQGFMDAQNDFARVHQLDKLGIRFQRELLNAIGHIALLDSYVKMGILGQRSAVRPILLVSPVPSNPCYLNYWRPYLPDMITDPVLLGLLSPVSKHLEDHPPYAVMNSSGQQLYGLYSMEREIQAQWDAEGRGPLLTLTDSDNERGWQCLRDLGVPIDAWFVGLHVREDFNILEPRNADINTYRLAIESIAARDGWVIRMGDPSMPSLPPIPQVIDYAHSEVRSDWMDVFLWAKCRFFIGTQSGPQMVPPTFGVPCVETNMSTLGLRLWFNKDLCIFKLHWSEKEARHLNFAEVISSALKWSECTEYRASQGIKLVDNTPEEINDVVTEMMDRLEGKLQYSNEDEELQERFDGLYINNACKAHARTGRDFLRKWEHLL